MKISRLLLILLAAVVSPCIGPSSLRAQSKPAWVEKLATLNLQLDASEFAGKYQMLSDPTRLMPEAIVGFGNDATRAVVVIGGQDMTDLGVADFADDEATAKRLESQKAELVKKSPAVKIEGAGIRVEGEFAFTAITTSTIPPQGPVIRSVTLTTIRDGCMVLVRALGENETAVARAADDAVRMLKPLRRKGAAREGTYPDYEATPLGFDTRLKDAGWHAWPEGPASFPGATIHARRGAATFLISEIIPLPEKGLPLAESFAALMRITTRFENAEDTLKIEKTNMPGFDEALKFSAGTEDAGKTSLVAGWCGLGGGRMMMTMTWTAAKDPAAAKNATDATDTKSSKDAKSDKEPGGAKPAPSPRSLLDAALAAVKPLRMTSAPAPSAFKQAARDTQSTVLCEIAAQLLRRGRNEDAASAYNLALRCSHTQLATLESAVMGMQRTGDTRRAEVLLTLYGDAFKDSPRLWLLRARLLNEAGDKTKAIDAYSKAFLAGLRDEEAVVMFMSLLWTEEKNDEALRFIETYEKAAPSPRIARWRAVTLMRMKEYDRALAAYATLVKARPLDVEAALQYGECANQAGKHDVALEAVALLLKENQDGARTRLLEGWAHYGKKEWREAKLSFEAARKFTPNDSIVLDALNSANAALGEGDSSAVKTPIDALPLPDAVRTRLEKAAADFKPDEDESAVNLLITTQIDFHAGKPTTTTERCRVKVLDTAGVDSFSTIDIKFDPLSERVFVNQLEVRDEAGRVVARGKPDDQYVTDPSMDGPATLGRVLRVPVPGLKPGRVLDYVFTKRTVDDDKVMRFSEVWFGSSHPTAAQAVIVQGDLNKIQVVLNDMMKKDAQLIEDSAARSRAWLLTPAMQVHSEPFLPRLATFAPVLWLGAPDTDWAKVGADYLKLIEEQLKPEPEIEVLAKKIIVGAKTDQEKIDRLSRHIREEITYKAIEFGRRARIPNRASRVTANHYGDCKDMSLLLHQLLRALGIDSHLVLINSRTDLAPDLPDLDQFNHMIVHVPSLKAGFVDCTEGKSAGVNLPPNLFGLHAFVLDPAKPRIVSMPARGEWPASRVDVQRDVSFDSDGGADVAESITLTDYAAQNMRQFLNSMPPQKRIDSMQAWQQRVSHWQLDKMEVEKLSDPASPLTLKLRYSIPPPALSSTRLLEVPATIECEYLEINHLRHRHHPYEVLHPLEIASRVKVTAPQPIDPASLRAITRKDETLTHCRWSLDATASAGGNSHECQLQFHAVLPAENGPASSYLPMRKAAAAAASAWHVPLRLGQ